MSDNCGSRPTEATIGRERANDKRESAKEVFKFIVSPNRGVWVILPVKNPLNWKYLEVFKLNLSLEFVNKAEIVRTENKNTTAMFAAFQNILAELNNFPPLLRTNFASRALLACLTNFSLSDSFKNQLKTLLYSQAYHHRILPCSCLSSGFFIFLVYFHWHQVRQQTVYYYIVNSLTIF